MSARPIDEIPHHAAPDRPAASTASAQGHGGLGGGARWWRSVVSRVVESGW
ncbi:hypothetical protein ACRYCC_42495 [Actinomadura scrupuli]|uniref:hypothetical protein n=1 Tax=Actinomadura scrupuli TaxID=559629 RepID=UPI003D97477E